MVRRAWISIPLLVALAAGEAGAAETAGELFVELDAAGLASGAAPATWTNAGTLADFAVSGAPVVVDINGATGILFSAGAGPDAYQSVDLAPDGLVGLDPTRSVEVWAFNEVIADEETLLSWGHRGGPCGSNMSFNYGSNAVYGAAGKWCDPDIGWGTVPVAGEWHHLVYTYDGTTTRVYADGRQTNMEVLGAGAINTHSGTKIAIAAQFESDGVTLNAGLAGTLAIGRVRIHDGVLTPEQIAKNHKDERPEFRVVNGVAPSFINPPAEDTYVSGLPAYERGLIATGFPPPDFEVVEPADATVSLDGLLSYAIPDPEPASFTVTVKAVNSEGEATATWTVAKRGAGETCTVGELFVDLDAAHPTAGGDVWTNEGTLGDFEKIGDPIVISDGCSTSVQFNGGATTDAYRCLDATPAGLVGLDPSRSIEAWVYNPAIADEETILSWSHRGGPCGSNMSFNYGGNAAFGAIGHWCDPDIGWGTVPAAGEWHHLVYTYDGMTTRMYADGVETASETLGLGVINTHADSKITVAAQTEADGVTLNTALVGTLSIGRVRIHDGVLTPAQIQHNYEEEKNDYLLSPPLILDAPAADFIKSGAATYARSLTIQGDPPLTLTAVSPEGAAITPEGFLTYDLPSPEPASFEVTVEVEGCTTVSATWTVTVVTPPTAALPVHRYSFVEDARDSIGSADGTIWGDVTFQDGQAVLNNDALPNSNANGISPPTDPPGAYIDLPNGIISALDNSATFETWTTWDGPIGSSWQRIFDFGTSNAGENSSGGADASYYIFLTPRSGSDTLRFGMNNPLPSRVERVIDHSRLTTGVAHHIAIVWDGAATTARMYLDGLLVAEDTAVHFALSTIPDVNNWLGRAQWPDPMYDGSYDEFRIYDYPFTEEQVRGAFVLGPDELLPEPVTGPYFIRGDTDGNGTYTIGDGIQILERLFANRPAFDSNCDDTGDLDDSGVFTIGDAVWLFNFLFAEGDLKQPPFPPAEVCGVDPTPDDLGCEDDSPACKPQ
ncbi:MAG: hypothetical protein JXP34_12580 [Planctomycetes bacterium]|nr:hypothetical protein [Planctomycetota bacterium]